MGYGLALLGAPELVARSLTGVATLDQPSRVVARILGTRHVLQALLLITRDRVWLRRAGRATDLLHAASMILLAVLAPGRERLALADAMIAGTLAGPAASTTGPGPSARPQDGDGRDVARAAEVFGSAELAELTDLSGARSRRQRRANLQHAINLTLRETRGAAPADIRAALERNIGRRGLACPPEYWLEAVTSDLARGAIYVVSGPAMQDIGARVPRGEPL
ncbi:hypothetical protein GCM10009845_20340 [Pedococcus bigeumensis]